MTAYILMSRRGIYHFHIVLVCRYISISLAVWRHMTYACCFLLPTILTSLYLCHFLGS